MDFITAFFGRFHPLLVHLPFGILFLAFLFECLSAQKRYRMLRIAVPPALLWGSIFAIASAISGYFLRQEGGYEESIAFLHQNFGIATAVFSLVVYVLRRRLKFWMINTRKRKQVRIMLFIPMILLLLITGHLGGSLTHGEDFLFSALTEKTDNASDPILQIKSITNIPDAMMYRDVIQPILEARCYDCHSSRKQKGELRLDKEELIVLGGKHGMVITDGVADSSILYKRLMLPLEDEHHMPPNEKPQLSSSEIALIKYWLEEKPIFEKKISEFKNNEKISMIITSLQEAPQKTWIPLEEVPEAGDKSLQKLKDQGIIPMPLAEGSNYIMVNFNNTRKLTDIQINALHEIKQQLIWLNLSYTSLTDSQMGIISKLSNIRALYLNYTQISDSGISYLADLSELRLLNVIGTQVTDHSIPVFLQLKNLTNLFLFQTLVTPEGIHQVSDSNQKIKVDTGNYVLQKRLTDTLIYKNTTKIN